MEPAPTPCHLQRFPRSPPQGATRSFRPGLRYKKKEHQAGCQSQPDCESNDPRKPSHLKEVGGNSNTAGNAQLREPVVQAQKGSSSGSACQFGLDGLKSCLAGGGEHHHKEKEPEEPASPAARRQEEERNNQKGVSSQEHDPLGETIAQPTRSGSAEDRRYTGDHEQPGNLPGAETQAGNIGQERKRRS